MNAASGGVRYHTTRYNTSTQLFWQIQLTDLFLKVHLQTCLLLCLLPRPRHMFPSQRTHRMSRQRVLLRLCATRLSNRPPRRNPLINTRRSEETE